MKKLPLNTIPTNFMQESIILIETLFVQVTKTLPFMSVTGREKKGRSCQMTVLVKDELLANLYFRTDTFLLLSAFLLYPPWLRTNTKKSVRTT